MGAQSDFGESDTEFSVLWWILFGVFCLGLGIGVATTLVWLRIRQWCGSRARAEHQVSSQGLWPPGWRSVVIRTLRFIRTRRKISLAFSNYRTKPLKHSPSLDSMQLGGSTQPGLDSEEESRGPSTSARRSGIPPWSPLKPSSI